jgi:hypothetical protein
MVEEISKNQNSSSSSHIAGTSAYSDHPQAGPSSLDKNARGHKRRQVLSSARKSRSPESRATYVGLNFLPSLAA